MPPDSVARRLTAVERAVERIMAIVTPEKKVTHLPQWPQLFVGCQEFLISDQLSRITYRNVLRVHRFKQLDGVACA